MQARRQSRKCVGNGGLAKRWMIFTESTAWMGVWKSKAWVSHRSHPKPNVCCGETAKKSSLLLERKSASSPVDGLDRGPHVVICFHDGEIQCPQVSCLRQKRGKTPSSGVVPKVMCVSKQTWLWFRWIWWKIVQPKCHSTRKRLRARDGGWRPSKMRNDSLRRSLSSSKIHSLISE